MTEFISAETLVSKGCVIEDNFIKSLDVVITAHFGNCVSVDLVCDCVCPIPLWNSTSNIGYILRTMTELFGKSKEDGVRLQEFVNTPIRIAYNKNKAVAIGNATEDKFIFVEDLMRVGF